MVCWQFLNCTRKLLAPTWGGRFGDCVLKQGLGSAFVYSVLLMCVLYGHVRYCMYRQYCEIRSWRNVYINAEMRSWKGGRLCGWTDSKWVLPFNNIHCWQFGCLNPQLKASQLRASQRLELMYSKAQQRPTHLLLAAVDLPLLLIGQSKHGFPVLIRQVQFILQQQQGSFLFIFKPLRQPFQWIRIGLATIFFIACQQLIAEKQWLI